VHWSVLGWSFCQLGNQEVCQSRAGFGSTWLGSQGGDDFSSAFPSPQSKYKQIGEGCKPLQLQQELLFCPQRRRHAACSSITLGSQV